MPGDTKLTIPGLLQQREVKCFLDQNGVSFARIRVDTPSPHDETWPINSKRTKRLIASILMDAIDGITPKDVADTIQRLDLAASSERRELFNRFAGTSTNLSVDLCDRLWRQIDISPQGWQVRSSTLAVFRRQVHQLEIPEPLHGGDFQKLFDFLPELSANKRILVTAWLAASLVPFIPKPILAFVGSQGSHKTTICRQLRSLIDPSQLLVMGELEQGNLVQIFDQHAVPCFDNVGQFSRREADAFCRTVTGGSVGRRKLFTDADEVIFSFRRPILLNGIDLPSQRADFLDRCLPIRLERATSFASNADLMARFEESRPSILGGLLDLLVKTLRLSEATPKCTEFRMADFATFGRAICAALGMAPCSFDQAYREVIGDQRDDALDASPVAVAMRAYFAKESEFEGTLKQLDVDLRIIAKRVCHKRWERDWPGNPRWLSSELSQLSPLLAEHGILIERLPRDANARKWRVTYRTAPAPARESDRPPATNPLMPTFDPTVAQITFIPNTQD